MICDDAAHASPPGIPPGISAVPTPPHARGEGGRLPGGSPETRCASRALMDRLLDAREVAEMLAVPSGGS
jgi:hypothetical protein